VTTGIDRLTETSISSHDVILVRPSPMIIYSKHGAVNLVRGEHRARIYGITGPRNTVTGAVPSRLELGNLTVRLAAWSRPYPTVNLRPYTAVHSRMMGYDGHCEQRGLHCLCTPVQTQQGAGGLAKKSHPLPQHKKPVLAELPLVSPCFFSLVITTLDYLRS